MISYPTVLTLLTATALGQFDAPLAGRPPNYSHAVGRFKITAEASPTKVLVEDPLRLRVIITGDAAEPPTRKSLAIFPDDFADSFFLEPLADDDVAGPNRWEFVWKLRPKSVEVREIPALAFVFWSPTVRRYLTARSDPLEIHVMEEQAKVAIPPAHVPVCFQDLATGSPPSVPLAMGPILMTLAGLAGGIAMLSWRLARPRKNRPSLDANRQRTLAAMNAAPADAAAIAMSFLKDQFAISSAETTPAEVDAVLKRHGVARAMRLRWMLLCRSEFAQRFAPSPPTFARDEAASLIQSLEVAP